MFVRVRRPSSLQHSQLMLVPLTAMPSQVQKVIGEKDLARYKRELAEEYGEDEVEDEEEEGKGAAGQRGQATGWPRGRAG